MAETPTPHDALFRWTFSHLEDARTLLRSQLPPDLASRLDWDSLAVESGTFVDDALKGRQADLLFSARFGDEEVLIYVLLEHQSSVDRWMPLWLVRYQVRIWEAWLREHPHATHLPLIVPVVLFHGARAWSGPTEFSALLDIPEGLDEALAPYLLHQRFLLDDITGVTDDVLRGRALSAFADLTLRALSRARVLSPDEIAHELARWLQLARAVARAPSGLQKLSALIQYLVEVAEVDEPTLAAFDRAINAPKEHDAMPTLAEKWKAEGLQMGLERGREEGRADLLLRLVQVKFGAVPPRIRGRVLGAGPDDVQRWSEALLTAPSLDALFED